MIVCPDLQPAEFVCRLCFPALPALSGRTGSTILRRMIIKRGRVAWTFGKRPRFVQQSALTADRNTWTRRQAGKGCGRERSGSRGGVAGQRGEKGPGDFNRGVRAALARRQERFCKMLNEASLVTSR